MTLRNWPPNVRRRPFMTDAPTGTQVPVKNETIFQVEVVVSLLTGISLGWPSLQRPRSRPPRARETCHRCRSGCAPNPPKPLRRRGGRHLAHRRVQRGHHAVHGVVRILSRSRCYRARGPYLLRSPIVAHDVKGNMIGDVVPNRL